MSRSELDPAVLAELEALDRILAGEPVDPSGPAPELELELAALVQSVRADVPTPDPDTARRLDERIAAATARRRHRRLRRPGAPAARRLWSAAAATAVAGAAVVTLVLTSGTTSPPATTRAGSAAISSAAAGAAVAPAPQAPGPALTPTSPNRLEQRAATITLATSPAAIGTVADAIITDSEQLGAIVQQSNVSEQGRASLATFSLDTPAGSLSQLIARLSQLAQVQSLNTSSLDITDSYATATDHLAASRSERDALFAALARATTVNETASLNDRIDGLTGRIAAEERAVSALRSESRTATVQVTLQPTDGSTAAPARGRLGQALHVAGNVLEAMAAAAIVGLAVIVPLALIALAAWALTRLARRRARERALERA